jgi:hypothetical protein
LIVCGIPQVCSTDSDSLCNLEEELKPTETGILKCPGEITRVENSGTDTVEKEIGIRTDNGKNNAKLFSSSSCQQHSTSKASESESSLQLQLHVHAALQESGNSLTKGKGRSVLERRIADGSKVDKRTEQKVISKGAREQTLSPASSTSSSSVNCKGEGRLPMEPKSHSTSENRHKLATLNSATTTSTAAICKVSTSHATRSGSTIVCNDASVHTKLCLKQAHAKGASINKSTEVQHGLRLQDTNYKKDAYCSGRHHPNGLQTTKKGISTTHPTGCFTVEDPLPRQQRMGTAESKERKKRRGFLPGKKMFMK